MTAISEPQVDEVMPYSEPSTEKKSGPGGKHEKMRTYVPEEAALVLALVEAHAPRWTHIAKEVSLQTGYERTAASVRNYYKRLIASKAIADRDQGIKKLNKCQMCGQVKRGHICRSGSLVVTPTERKAPPSADPAENLLALAGRGYPLLPLAPSSLEDFVAPGTTPGASVVTTPGVSPLSGPLSGPLSALSGGPFSPSAFALPAGSPVVLGPVPAAVNPFAREHKPTVYEMEAEAAPGERKTTVFVSDMELEAGEETALAALTEVASCLPIASCEVVQPSA